MRTALQIVSQEVYCCATSLIMTLAEQADREQLANQAFELACQEDEEAEESEFLEFWIVSDWLADKLVTLGERVDPDFAGLTIWARKVSGQSIASDEPVLRIANGEG